MSIHGTIRGKSRYFPRAVLPGTLERVEYFKIELPAGIPLLNANQRLHWSKKAAITAFLRTAAREQAKGKPKLEKVKIRAVYYAPDNRRRDVSNLFPSVKASVDGLVDSGVLDDDSDKYVVSLEMVRGGENRPGGQLVIEVIEAVDV